MTAVSAIIAIQLLSGIIIMDDGVGEPVLILRLFFVDGRKKGEEEREMKNWNYFLCREERV